MEDFVVPECSNLGAQQHRVWGLKRDFSKSQNFRILNRLEEEVFLLSSPVIGGYWILLNLGGREACIRSVNSWGGGQPRGWQM